MKRMGIACCRGDTSANRPAPRRGLARHVLDQVAWIAPGTVLALTPKCPACLAATLAVATGVGLSFKTAAVLRGALIVVCAASLIVVAARRIPRLLRLAAPPSGSGS